MNQAVTEDAEQIKGGLSKSPKTTPEGYYVYVFTDLEGVPRYVGKGTGNRHADRSPYARSGAVHLLLKSKKHMPVEIVASGLTEEEAYALEAEIIGRFGRQVDGGTLFNVSVGRGTLAHDRSVEAASAMSLAEVTRLVGEEWLKQNRYVLPLTRPLYQYEPHELRHNGYLPSPARSRFTKT